MHVVMISSAGRCGIREYSYILMDGFRELGHSVRYIEVERHNNRDLIRAVQQVEAGDEIIIFEYEPGIFWLGGLIRAMARLRFWQRKRIILSVHEIAPEKYVEARQIVWHLSRPVARSPLFELLKLIPATADIIVRFLMLRVGLLVFGRLPHKILVHSAKGAENIHLSLADDDKVHYVPHLVKQLTLDKNGSRRRLALPDDVFAFIAPGFLFRRKRIVDVIQQLPPNVELWVVGTESEHDPGYLAEIQKLVSQITHPDRVRLIQDYERMEQYLIAADAAVFYYADGFQSGVASLAVGAGKPCIFSDLPAFSDLRQAGLVARSSPELRRAMEAIQDPILYRQLKENVLTLRTQLAPRFVAAQYLQDEV